MTRLDQDLSLWEEGILSLDDLRLRNPADGEVDALIALDESLEAFARLPEPDAPLTWAKVHKRIRSEAPAAGDRLRSKRRRSLALGLAAALLSASAALAVPSVRDTARAVLEGIGRRLGLVQEADPRPRSESRPRSAGDASAVGSNGGASDSETGRAPRSKEQYGKPGKSGGGGTAARGSAGGGSAGGSSSGSSGDSSGGSSSRDDSSGSSADSSDEDGDEYEDDEGSSDDSDDSSDDGSSSDESSDSTEDCSGSSKCWDGKPSGPDKDDEDDEDDD